MILDILYIFLYIVCALIALILIVYFLVRHRLKFDKTNKPIDKIVIYGDVRSSYKNHNRIINLIKKEKPDMILFTGDIASNSHNFLHFLIYSIIENKVWRSCEYYPIRGNHESEIYHYQTFLDLPNNKTYYSFDRMDMHFIVLDVIDESLHNEVISWLKKDLEENKDKNISVGMHYPLFTSGKYYPYHAPYLLELFDEYNVIFVFSAHVHSYERSLYKGTNYIVTAGGGAPLYPETITNEYKVCRVNKHHYCVMTKHNDEYTIKVIDIDGKQIDEFSSSKTKVIAGKL